MDPYPVVQGPRVNLKGSVDGLDGRIDIVVRVRIAHDERGHDHPATEGFLQEERPELLRRSSVRPTRAKSKIHGPTTHFDMALESVMTDGLAHSFLEPLALAIELLYDGFAPVRLHRGKRRGE